MKKDILETLPYNSIEELINLREYFTNVASENISRITRQNTSDENILCEFRENVSGYYFKVSDFKFVQAIGKNNYRIHRKPQSKNVIQGDSFYGTFEDIQKHFSKWIDVCKTMNEIKHKFLHPYHDFYEEEFSDFFSNHDDDASINPFEIERQEVLFYFLTFAEKKINASDCILNERKIELLNEVSELKDSIPKETKKILVHRISKFAKKTKEASNILFHDIFDVLKKELIKKILYEGVAQAPNAISKIEHWISLLIN